MSRGSIGNVSVGVEGVTDQPSSGKLSRSGTTTCNRKIGKVQESTGHFRESPGKSRKVQESPGKSRKVQESPGKSGKVQKVQ
jgi:hypothetical protein